MVMKISELATYYIRRYNLRIKGISDSADKYVRETFNNRIKQKIIRLLHDTHIGPKESPSLYDSINPKKGERKIDVDTFEMYCFEEFATYIEKNIKHDSAALERDKIRYCARRDKNFWDKEAVEFNKAINEKYESGSILTEPEKEDSCINYYTHQEIIDTGLHMMIQALYNLKFENFNWYKLERDMQSYAEIDYNPGANNSAENVRAMYDLQDYHNYTGDPKN